MFITGRLRWLQFLVYSLGQIVGAFLGAFFVWCVYFDNINKFKIENNTDFTIGIFGTFPNVNVSIIGGLFDQFFATSLLIMVVLAVSDRKNAELPNGTGENILLLSVEIRKRRTFFL